MLLVVASRARLIGPVELGTGIAAVVDGETSTTSDKMICATLTLTKLLIVIRGAVWLLDHTTVSTGYDFRRARKVGLGAKVIEDRVQIVSFEGRNDVRREEAESVQEGGRRELKAIDNVKR